MVEEKYNLIWEYRRLDFKILLRGHEYVRKEFIAVLTKMLEMGINEKDFESCLSSSFTPLKRNFINTTFEKLYIS